MCVSFESSSVAAVRGVLNRWNYPEGRRVRHHDVSAIAPDQATTRPASRLGLDPLVAELATRVTARGVCRGASQALTPTATDWAAALSRLLTGTFPRQAAAARPKACGGAGKSYRDFGTEPSA